MTVHMKDATGTWRQMTSIHAKDATGTWREIHEGWMKDATGTWRQFYDYATVTVSGYTTVNAGSAPRTAGIRFNSDGTTDSNTDGGYAQVNASTDWIIPNGAASGSYEIRATLISGSGVSGTFGSWLALSSNHEWSLTTSVTASATVLLEIRKNGGAVIDSANYIFDVTIF